MTTFGKVPPSKSNAGFDMGISDDRRAFTLTFSDLQASAGQQASAMRHFSLAVPLEGAKPKTEIEFTVQGFAFTTAGAAATLLFNVNGQSSVTDLPANTDKSVVLTTTFTAAAPAECRLTLVLLVGRDAGKAGAEATLTVSSIDAEVLPHAT